MLEKYNFAHRRVVGTLTLDIVDKLVFGGILQNFCGPIIYT